MFDLSGKVALVTGGARGIGEAIAQGLAANGAALVLCDIDFPSAKATAERLSDEHGQPVTPIECDVSDRQQVQDSVAAAVDEYGRIDVLVNNAGIHRRVDPVEWSQPDVDIQLSINLLGNFYVAGAVGRVMIEQQSGSIINISALGGGVAGLGRSGSIYGMTKGAIVSLTRDLAAEWGKYSIRVNALAPGWIRTPMTEGLQNNPERFKKVLERIPLQRWGEAADIAGAAVFLASDAATYISGHTIPIDGGAANVIAISQ